MDSHFICLLKVPSLAMHIFHMVEVGEGENIILQIPKRNF